MEYKIIATAEIPAADETALANLISSIQTFVSNNSGTLNLLIRTS